MKVLLELILVLQLSAVISEKLVYYGHGQEAVVPCGDHPPDSCSITTWVNVPGSGLGVTVVEKGKVLTDTPQSARLRITSDCSLVINNVTAEDVGFYTCRQGRNPRLDQDAVLSVLTLSPSPPDADPNGELTLTCSLSIHRDTVTCGKNIIRWLDETGGELKGSPVTRDCVSVLTGQNRKRTCQFVHDDTVQVEVHYTPDIKEVKTSDPDPGGDASSTNMAAVGGAVGGALVVLLTVTVILIIYRKKSKATESVPTAPQHADDSEAVTYTTINHTNHQPAALNQVREEVTYAAVKTEETA